MGEPVPDLLGMAADLVGIPSVSLGEADLAAEVDRRLRALGHLSVTRVGDNVVARTDQGGRRRLVLAGHLDTVPPAGNAGARLEGETLWGVGAADMKGGLAVMLALAGTFREPAVDVTFAFYAGEEVDRRHNGLLQVADRDPSLLEADAAVLCEPTAAVVEAGCQGVLKAEVHLGGLRAHTARPWKGVNAVHRLGPLLERVSAYQGRRPLVDGCEYREALQAVGVAGGVAGNVVPDSATLQLNHRFAPDRDAPEAEAALRHWLGPVLEEEQGDRLSVVEAAPAAPPALGDPLLARLVAASGAPPRAKLGWTDVAFFAERGVPAANFGPGEPELAHTPHERVSRSELEACYRAIAELLSGTDASTGSLRAAAGQ